MLEEFAASHSALVDMIYPYMTRTVQSQLATWSSGVDFAVWQVILTAVICVGLLLVVLMFILKWNPIQLAGWALAVVTLYNFANTAVYGLNYYSGPLAEDLRMENSEYAYDVSELERAAVYYREFANAMSNQIARDSNGQPVFDDFDTLKLLAADSYHTLVYDRYYPVFSGSTQPVKKLELSDKSQLGITVPLTGESAVDPRIPSICQPFAICREMSRRMCIAVDRDSDFAGFLACDAGSTLQYRYSGYFMAYRSCYKALEEICNTTGDRTPLQNLKNGESTKLKSDIQTYEAYFGDESCTSDGFCDMLVLWHIETVILPQMEEEEEVFDPTDENQVDLSGIVNANP